MSTVLSIKFTPISLRTQFSRTSRTCFCKPPFSPSIFSNRSFAAKIRASSTAFVEAKPADPIVVEKEVGAGNNNLACPICFDPLTWKGDSVLSIASTAGSSLQCNTCKKTYSSNETHIDLTAASGSKQYGQFVSPISEFFRLPLISFLYERGWRQNFLWLGFPGPEKEFEMMKDYLKPVLGGNIIDASCGSGLFSRLFAKSGLFSHVVALDYSESMLQQCYEYIGKEENFPQEKVTLIRADISRLPFVSSSIDAVHAGAAIHCWPSPPTAIVVSVGDNEALEEYKEGKHYICVKTGLLLEEGNFWRIVAEISRVLRPGGVLVATTYILDGPYAFFPHLRMFRKNIMAVSGNQTFLSEHELEEICRTCGLVDFTCTRNRRFVMFSATKPN